MFPTIKKVCDYFDCRVIWELTDNAGWIETCCHLGSQGDMSVGIFPYTLTPEFLLESDLEEFCASHEGQAKIDKMAREIFPDYPFDGVRMVDLA